MENKRSEQELDQAIAAAMGQVAQLFMSQDVKGTEMYMPVAEVQRISTDLANVIKQRDAERKLEELEKSDGQFKTKTKAWKEYHEKRKQELETEVFNARIVVAGRPGLDEFKVDEDAISPLQTDEATPESGNLPPEESDVKRETYYQLDNRESPRNKRQKSA